MTTATLLITAADQPGLVAAVSAFLLEHRGNILHADQHTDEDEGVFLQRVEWALDGFQLDRAAIGPAFARVAERFGMTWDLRFSDHRPRVALLVSKRSHCLYDLLARWKSGELPAEIPLIVSNHDSLADVAARFDVPFHHLPVTATTKAEQEAQIHRLLVDNGVELVVLARYMQILSNDFTARWEGKVINIHHSFLPAFMGARPYHRAHARGVKIIGATAHYVTAQLDEGPIIEQDVARVSHRNGVRDLVARGRDLETIVLSRAVSLHLRNRVLVYGNKTVVFG